MELESILNTHHQQTRTRNELQRSLRMSVAKASSWSSTQPSSMGEETKSQKHGQQSQESLISDSPLLPFPPLLLMNKQDTIYFPLLIHLFLPSFKRLWSPSGGIFLFCSVLLPQALLCVWRLEGTWSLLVDWMNFFYSFTRSQKALQIEIDSSDNHLHAKSFHKPCFPIG